MLVGVPAQRFVLEVDQHGAGDGHRDHERRRPEIGAANRRMQPAFKVAVAGQYSANGQVPLRDRVRDRLWQRARHAAATHASVAGHVEAEARQRLHQPGTLKHGRDGARARRQRRLDCGPGAQAAGDRVSGQQPGGKHLPRVGRVGAGGDGRDHHVAGLGPPSVRRGRGCGGGRKGGTEAVRHTPEGHARFRPGRPGHDWLRCGQVIFNDRVTAGRVSCGAEQALVLGVGLYQRHARGGAAGQAQELQRATVDGKVAHRGAVFRRHVRDRRAVGHRQGVHAWAEELHHRPEQPGRAQPFRQAQCDICREHARWWRAGQTATDHARRQQPDWLS